MAQLKDLLVAGPSRFIGDVYADQISAKNVFSDWLPSITNTYSLGSENLKWKNLYVTTLNADGLNSDGNLSVGGNLVVVGISELRGNTTIGVNNTSAARTHTIYGHVIVEPSKHSSSTTNSYNEGIRINRDSNGWANVIIGGTSGTVSGNGKGVWLVGTQATPNDATTAAGSITASNFYISYAQDGSSNAATRIQGHTAAGFSVRPRLYVNADAAADGKNFYVNGTTQFAIGTSDNASDKNFIIGSSGRRYLAFGGSGVQAYDASNAVSKLYLNYNGGSLDIGSSTNGVTGTLYGLYDFKTGNGFTYSGIGTASDNTYRPIWFSYNGVNGRPVYSTKFKYNPSSNHIQFDGNGGLLSTSGNTISITSSSTLYLNSGSTASIIFTRGGSDTSHEISRIDTNNNFIPSADNLRNIGASDKRWKEIHAVDLYGHLRTDELVPVISKVYEDSSYYATSSGSWETSSWYFMSVKPDEWYKPWTVRFKIHTYVPEHLNQNSTSYCTVSGRADSIIYANWNERYDHAHYYTVVYPLKQAGFNAGYGHAIGISILYAGNYTNSGYPRTFEVDYYDCEECTVTLLDTPVKWASWTGTGTTNYGSLASMNAVDRGLQESGDANSTTISTLYKQYGGYVAANNIKRYQVVFTQLPPNGNKLMTIYEIDNAYGTTNKQLLTTEFDPLGPIYYYNSSGTNNAGTNIDPGRLYYSVLTDMRYSFNIANTAGATTTYQCVAYTPTYLKVSINGNTGGASVASDQPLVNELPTTNDGFYYIYLGQDYDWYRIMLSIDHPVYYHNGTEIVRYYGKEIGGNAATATKFASAQSITLTGAVTGTVSSQAGWTISTTGKYLDLYEARGTTTTLNKAANYVKAGAMFHLVASSSTSATDNGKTPTDSNVLQMNWDNNGGYDSQFAISTTGSRGWFRSQASTKTAWREIVTTAASTAVGGNSIPVYVDNVGSVTALTNYVHVSTYSIPATKGVRITYPIHAPVLISAQRSNSGGRLILIGGGYGHEATVRNDFTELVSCGESSFIWSLPESTSISHSIEIMNPSSSGNASIIVWSKAEATFTEITALTSPKTNHKLLNSLNYTDYTVTKTGGGASGTWAISISGSANSVAWSGITSPPETATRWPKWNEITQQGADSIDEGNSDFTDNTELFSSYASNNGFADSNAKGKVYRRDAIKLYNYIKTKAGTSGSGFNIAGNAATSDQTKVTEAPVAITKDYILMSATAPTSTATTHTLLSSKRMWVNSADKGKFELVLGNETATTTAGGQYGQLALYSSGTKGTYLTSAANSTKWYTATLQAADGTIAYTSDITTAIQALDVTEATNTAGKTINKISETDGKISVTFQNISITKSQISDFAHDHSQLITAGNNRSVATTPNTYANKLIFQGLKTNSAFGSPSSDYYSYVVGLRGWSDSSGGDAHELAFNNTGVFWRHGATTSWGNWFRILDSNTTKAESSSAVSVTWNTETTIATINGTAVKIKIPANPNTNTDTLVKQTVKSDNVNYKLLATTSASPSSGTAMEATYSANVFANASTGSVSAQRHTWNASGTDKAYTTWNATDESIDFVFV